MKKDKTKPGGFRAFLAFAAVLVAFSPARAQYPYLQIADVMVTPENQDSITSNYITGMVRYDSASRTLILQNATIYRCDDPSDTYDDDYLGRTVSLEAHINQVLNVELVGQNSIYGIIPLSISEGSYNIVGTGSLVLNGMVVGVSCGLGVDTFRIRQGASVVIDVPYHPAGGFQGSSQYQDYDQTVLVIDSGTLIINADYCIQSIVGLLLNGSCVVTPEGAYYDPGSKTLVTANGPVRDYLEIRPGTVGVETYSNNSIRAWGGEGGIHVEGVQESSPVEIINMLGQVIHRATLNGMETFLPMKRGVYVVRANNSAVKVVVK